MYGKRCDICGKFYKTNGDDGETYYDDYVLTVQNHKSDTVIKLDVSRDIMDELSEWIESKQAKAISEGDMKEEDVKRFPWRKRKSLRL